MYICGCTENIVKASNKVLLVIVFLSDSWQPFVTLNLLCVLIFLPFVGTLKANRLCPLLRLPGQTSRMVGNSTDDPSSVQFINQCNRAPHKSSCGANSALHLLASTYGPSDSESDEVINGNVVGCSSGHSGMRWSEEDWRGEALTDASVKQLDMLGVLNYDKDSSRKHVFCLEHALKVWRELQKIGGADIMLLCHPG